MSNPNVATMAESDLRKTASSLARRKTLTAQQAQQLTDVRRELGIRMGIEFTTPSLLGDYTWRMIDGAPFTTIKVDDKRVTFSAGQLQWAAAHYLFPEDMVGVKVNRRDVEHPLDYRASVLTLESVDRNQAASRLERTEVPECFRGLRYDTAHDNWYVQKRQATQGNAVWASKLVRTRSVAEAYYMLECVNHTHDLWFRDGSKLLFAGQIHLHDMLLRRARTAVAEFRLMDDDDQACYRVPADVQAVLKQASMDKLIKAKQTQLMKQVEDAMALDGPFDQFSVNETPMSQEQHDALKSMVAKDMKRLGGPWTTEELLAQRPF